MDDRLISSERFFKELSTFRTIVGDKRNSIARMDKAYGILFLVSNRVDPKDPRYELTKQAWETTSEEFIRRKDLLIMARHPLE